MAVDDPPTSPVNLDGLFRTHATQLLRLAVVLTGDRGLSEELVQDAFVRLAQSKSPPRIGAELAYLRRIVVNLTHGHHRRLAVARRHQQEGPPAAAPAEASAMQRDVQRCVSTAVRALPARQRDCIVLRCYAGATDAEIADALDISVGTVKTHLHRARAALAKQLEDLR